MVNVTVIGLGAMGGGMARALLRSSSISTVSGCDISEKVVEQFQAEALSAGKDDREIAISSTNLSSSVTPRTDVVVLVLVNEKQCNQVCFANNGNSLIQLMKADSTVMLSATVTALWAKEASEIFEKKSIHFVDCPMSGGPVRAKSGELTMMASGSEESLNRVDPLLKSMGKEIHIIPGGSGMGSTVKMVHQLLAGVHIVVAAEALALAAKAGVDVKVSSDYPP
jgi:putative dehydrogenase